MSSNTNNNNNRFLNKVALVTGATSGIGKAVAFALAEAGASVVVVGRRVDEGRAVVEQISKAGGRAAYFKADTSKEEEVEKMVDFTVSTFGRLDLAFNNAGVEFGGPTTEVTEADYERVFGVNVWGVLASMKHEIRAMLKSGGGSIVNTSSVLGLKGIAGVAVYSASKHAVQGLTKSVALEYAKQGIRVNVVAPGPVQTEMMDRFAPTEQHKTAFASTIPLGRFGREEELVGPVLSLLDPANSFVTGSTYVVDGGALA
jgi:NAD(P)-dependent dehydrogenase (short-subunit alcohol dehydrogenase family)|eukprot:gene27205-biopygen4173